MMTSRIPLPSHDFVVFSDDWGRHPFSCQHLMRCFLPQSRLIWVETIGLRRPRLNLYDLRRAAGKIHGWLRPERLTGGNASDAGTDGMKSAGVKLAVPVGQASGNNRDAGRSEPPKNPYRISPFMIPYNTIKVVRACNRRGVVRAVRRAMDHLGMRSPILLATLPDAGDYAGSFNEILTVYYCVDDFTLWPGMNQPELVRDMEAKLLAKADLVVAVSESLSETRATPRGPTRLLTHGADPAHFAAPALPAPEELANTPAPIIGFFGLMDEHFDVDLLRDIATKRPNWNFVCIGAKRISLTALENLPNFRRLAAVPYERLPAYAARFDVAVMPYRLTEHTRTANPLKLREYIATGKPVVSTPLPEALRFAGHIRIAGDAAAFADAIEEALADATPPETRRAALVGETWADKAALFAGWIEEALAGQAKAALFTGPREESLMEHTGEDQSGQRGNTSAGRDRQGDAS